MWETSGQHDNDGLQSSVYWGADVYLACYAIDRPISLANIRDKWVPDVSLYSPNIPIILVGSKSELRDSQNLSKTDQKLVPKEDVAVVAKEIGALEYLECSSATKDGVLAVFEAAARAVLLADQRKKSDKCALQ